MARERETETGTEGGWLDWILKSAKELRNGILVGAALVATLSFQAVVSPPCGFWQDDLVVSPNDILRKNHTAGNPIWKDKYPSEFKRFRTVNILAFGLSISAIILTLTSIIEKAGVFTMLGAAIALLLSLCLAAAAYSFAMSAGGVAVNSLP